MTKEEAQRILPSGSPRWSSHTRADWRPCKPPYGPPTHISASGSLYWEFGDGVVRGSNHWGWVSSCYWTIGGQIPFLPEGAAVYGYARWEDFVDLWTEREANFEAVKQARIESRAVDLSGYRGAESGFIPVAVGQRIRFVREYFSRSTGGWYRRVTEELEGVVERLTPHFIVVDGQRIARHTVKYAYLV